nr:hypothetical protein [uncultured Caldimonas sp.]
MTPSHADQSAPLPHDPSPAGVGQLALQWVGKHLPLQVLRSQAGHYIGTADHEGYVSRESVEYFGSEKAAYDALVTCNWTQRLYP